MTASPSQSRPARRVVSPTARNAAGDPRGGPGGLGVLSLTAIGIGHIAGGGIIALTAVATSQVGAAFGWALAIAAVAVLLAAVPIALLAGADPAEGATYRWPARYLHPAAGFLTTWMTAATFLTLTLYALSVGHYAKALWPQAPVSAVAIGVIVVLVGVNLAGARVAAIGGILLAVSLIAAFSLLAVAPPVADAGGDAVIPAAGFAATAALLTLATSGAWHIVNLGGEAVRPRRTMPWAILFATALLGFVLVVAAFGVTRAVPADQLPGQPFVVLAERILSPGAGQFFLLGGAIVALIAPINANLLTGTRPLMAAAADGWLPRSLALRSRLGAPLVLLTGIGILAVTLVLLDLHIVALASAAAVAVPFAAGLLAACSLLLRHRNPDRYRAGSIRLPYILHAALVLGAVALSGYQVYLLGASLSAAAWLAGGIWLALGVVIWLVRGRTVAARAASTRGDDPEVDVDREPHAEPASDFASAPAHVSPPTHSTPPMTRRALRELRAKAGHDAIVPGPDPDTASSAD